MEITVRNQADIDIGSLAKALAESTPEEFARFWFKFSEHVEGDKLEEFGRAMAPKFGGIRKTPLRTFNSIMEYYEHKIGEDQ